MRVIQVVVVIQLLVGIFTSIPLWPCTVLGIVAHGLYSKLLVTFPYFDLSSPKFILSASMSYFYSMSVSMWKQCCGYHENKKCDTRTEQIYLNNKNQTERSWINFQYVMRHTWHPCLPALKRNKVTYFVLVLLSNLPDPLKLCSHQTQFFSFSCPPSLLCVQSFHLPVLLLRSGLQSIFLS